MVILSTVLDRLMAEKGLTGVEVAKGTGLTPTAISYYRNGERMPGAAELYALARFFDVPMEYFMTTSPPPRGRDLNDLGELYPSQMTQQEFERFFQSKMTHVELEQFVRNVRSLGKWIDSFSTEKPKPMLDSKGLPVSSTVADAAIKGAIAGAEMVLSETEASGLSHEAGETTGHKVGRGSNTAKRKSHRR